MTDAITQLFELCFSSISAVLQFDEILKIFLGYVLLVVCVGVLIALIGMGISDRRMKK